QEERGEAPERGDSDRESDLTVTHAPLRQGELLPEEDRGLRAHVDESPDGGQLIDATTVRGTQDADGPARLEPPCGTSDEPFRLSKTPARVGEEQERRDADEVYCPPAVGCSE